MKTLNTKRNILLYIVSVIAVVLLAAACMLCMFSAPSGANAEGNNAGSSMIPSEYVTDLELDVNGTVPTDDERDGQTNHSRTENNAKRYSVRDLPASVVREWFSQPSGGYRYDQTSVIKSSNAFNVTFTSNNMMRVTAKELTEENLRAYFSVVLYSYTAAADGSEERLSELRIYFRVTIYDTFMQSSGTQTAFYVGYKVQNGQEVDKDGKAGSSYDGIANTHAAILTVKNNSTFTVDLGEYLQGRALYNTNGSRINMNIGGGETTPWTLNSVKNFEISSAAITGLPGVSIENMLIIGSTAYSEEQSRAPIRIAPSFTGSIRVKKTDVDGYNSLHGGLELNAFWNTIHNITVVLHQVGNDELGVTTIYIPFVFAPANPQLITISSDVFRLNNSSENTYDINNNTYYDGSGQPQSSLPDQRAIIIRPEDLLDYAFPSNYTKMTFVNQSTKLDGQLITEAGAQQYKAITISQLEGELNPYYPSAYKIEANSSFTQDASSKVTFLVSYYYGTTDIDSDTIEVEIDVELYGSYSVTFTPIRGKRAVSYNALTHDVFAAMRDRGYVLTDAVSTDTDKLLATFEGNILTLTPQIQNVSGEENIPITLTFTNYKRQTITFDSTPVNLDVNAGSLFARFDDWEAGLIIAAICVAGLCLLLFIAWLFIRAIGRHRQDMLATQAPVSSYIKLNTTIAQAQANQRAAQTQALVQASQMLLGAGGAPGVQASSDTLALAAGGGDSVATGSTSQPGSSPSTSEPQTTAPSETDELYALIAKYITDEELLERIFTEKYEPKGMVRRTFFKSKDLQARELEKEKKRIIERYKSPMPMDEAVMSDNSGGGAERTSTPSEPMVTEEAVQEERFVLDFDPDSPLYVEPAAVQDEFAEEKIDDIDMSPEEKRLRDAEHNYDILLKELAELEKRLGKVETELGKAKSYEDELREKIAKAEADDAQYAKDIEDLEFKLASAKNKDKPIITRDIGIKEEKKKRNLDELEKLRAELDKIVGSDEMLSGVKSKLDAVNGDKTAQKPALESEVEKARAAFEAYQKRLAEVRAKQELAAKVAELTPMLVAVNETDYELKRLAKQEEEQNKERDKLKDAVAAAKSQILGTSDFGIISDLNTQISDANARLSELEKETVKITKRKSELGIEFNSARRKANDFIGKNEIPLEEVIKAEDAVLGNIELELLKAKREKDKEEAEQAVAEQQAVYDDLSASSNDIAIIAMEIASAVADAEEELAAAQAELDEVNERMENASEDEKLLIMVEQGDKADRVEELKAKLEEINVEGTKRKMEAQAEHDAKLEEARQALNVVNEEFTKACATYDDVAHNTDPLDLIESGSGPISRDQKIIEAENYKKQLERQKNEAEQARLMAQQAQEESERIRRESEEATEAARLEAERIAEQARLEAEQARAEAEEKARLAAEQARLEAEQARAEAEEAQRKAQEEAAEAQRKAQEEAEEAQRKAQEEAEEAQRKAQEEAEEAQRKAQEEAEEAQRKAQEEIEEMKRKAEEEAEAKRIEEENKKKEEEERQKAEAERNEALAKKIAMRKEQIVAIRNEMKELKGDEDAKALRERLYNIQTGYDEDERGSTELMDFYNKTMDDIQNAGEIARLKAENAKKPKRVVRKVTERVTRKPKRRPRPGARPGARRPGARPAARAGARPGAARPGARPAARPGARPAARPGARPGAHPGSRPR